MIPNLPPPNQPMTDPQHEESAQKLYQIYVMGGPAVLDKILNITVGIAFMDSETPLVEQVNKLFRLLERLRNLVLNSGSGFYEELEASLVVNYNIDIAAEMAKGKGLSIVYIDKDGNEVPTE